LEKSPDLKQLVESAASPDLLDTESVNDETVASLASKVLFPSTQKNEEELDASADMKGNTTEDENVIHKKVKRPAFSLGLGGGKRSRIKSKESN
jgi:hypothetical protein